MKKKNNVPNIGSDIDPEIRSVPVLLQETFPLDPQGTVETSEIPQTPQAPEIPESQYAQPDFEDSQYEGDSQYPEIPVTLNLRAHPNYDRRNIPDMNDPSEDVYWDTHPRSVGKPKKSRTSTLYEPRQKKKTWVRPIYIIIFLAIITVVVLAVSLLYSSFNLKEQLTSPLTVKDEQISNAEFSFIYHYVLIENGINIFDKSTDDVLSGPGQDNFATNREYFLDMAAQQIQVMKLLYDDATAKGYKITDSQKQRAQAYIDWLSEKASNIGVDLDTYIKGYYGKYVTQDLIKKVLAEKYYTDDYKDGPKLDELKATDEQAEEAYSSNQYQFDQVSYRVLRIIFEQTDDSFKATAHLHAQEIIDGIGHDESKFESVAANFFTGDAKAKILQPNSTLISNVRYANVKDIEWRTWLFDPARTPGDCTIFDDENGFPILVCFSARTRQTEPLRDIRFFYINREDTASGKVGIPDSEILPLAQTILDSVTDESSMQSLETTYADEIAADKMKATHDSDTYKGVLSGDLDSWIFDPSRIAGDKTLIETDSQIIIAYYVGASENPEWFDRVNSFIRMNNFQAFLLEKKTEYPYTFNSNGLSYIKDVP